MNASPGVGRDPTITSIATRSLPLAGPCFVTSRTAASGWVFPENHGGRKPARVPGECHPITDASCDCLRSDASGFAEELASVSFQKSATCLLPASKKAPGYSLSMNTPPSEKRYLSAEMRRSCNNFRQDRFVEIFPQLLDQA